jgi:hypothetical protein
MSAEPLYRPEEPPVMTIQRLRSSLAVLQQQADALVRERDHYAQDVDTEFRVGAFCGALAGLLIGFVISGCFWGVW